MASSVLTEIPGNTQVNNDQGYINDKTSSPVVSGDDVIRLQTDKNLVCFKY